MKKKKLKKEIKELHKEITHHREMISNLGDRYVKLQTDLTKLMIRINLHEKIVDELRKEEENG